MNRKKSALICGRATNRPARLLNNLAGFMAGRFAGAYMVRPFFTGRL